MTEQKTLTEAIEGRYAGAEGDARERTNASWKTPHDDRLQAMADLRRSDPDAYAAMRPTGEDAIYATTHEAAVRTFRWDSMMELATEQRAAGATFSEQLDKALDVYAGARAEAEKHGFLEAARKAANGGSK